MTSGIYPRTEKHKQINSEAQKGKHLSEETKRKISEAFKGNKNPNYGKRFSEEYRKKLSESHKGKHHTEEQKEKIGQAQIGKKYTEESKKKMSAVRRKLLKEGKIVLWNKGKTNVYSEETKRKMREKRLHRVIPTKDTNIEILIQNELKKRNISFILHYPIIGQPDIFIKSNICIFIDGCYWHGCPLHFPERNNDKDENITEKLRQSGFIVLRFWEHDILNNLDDSINKIMEVLNSNGKNTSNQSTVCA